MAGSKRTRLCKQRTKFLRFQKSQAKQLNPLKETRCARHHHFFSDKTALSFDLDPMLVVFPELVSLKTGNWRCTRRWPALRNK